MIEYHVYGKVVKEYYHMGLELYMYRYSWHDKEYVLDRDSEEDKVFKHILNQHILYKQSWENNIIPMPFRNKWFWKGYEFLKYKEFKVINVDLELRDGDIIQMENQDYEVKYKYNDDKKQNELYIDKIVETIVDEEKLRHAKEVCNGVVKKIIKYNKDIEEKENETSINKDIDNELFIHHKENSFNKSEEKRSRFKNMKLIKIWRDWFREERK
ncbi:hypothetical protein ACSW9O_15440 (plasmid) [Clostridium perfringens]